MNVIKDITIDLLRPKENVFHVVQEDSSRQIRLTLLENNLPFYVAADLDEGEELLKFVEFKKPDGHGGIYDTTSLGETAVVLEDSDIGNVWIVTLDGQCFTCPGWTQINVRFETEAGRRIHTFRIMVDVEPTASSDTESTDWGELNSIADLRNAVADLAVIVERIAGNTGLSEGMKQALLACFEKVAWIDEHGQDYVDALETALYPPAELLSISAVFEQGTTVIYDTDSLDDLKPMLTVTAHYTDGTSAEVTTYTLSGTLTEGTSTITVSYGGKTTTISVLVTERQVNTGYTEIGSPTITDGILTVANGKFVKSNVAFSPGDSSWKITCKARSTGSPPAVYADIFGGVDASNASVRSFLIEMNNMNTVKDRGGMFLSSNSSAWDITATQSGAFTLAQSITNWTWMELAYDGSQYTFKASTDGTTFETFATVTSTAKVYGGFAVGFGLNRSGYLNGEIDLNECKIYIDGALYWKAIA